MDAKELGRFIVERRKELGLTQALLAERMHVTDKAISRWERGVGLPDINNIEALVNALDVSLIELMQAERNINESIPTEEAEKLLIDTIQLSKNRFVKFIGNSILSVFAIIGILLCALIISDEKIVVR